jgi:MFS family permease
MVEKILPTPNDHPHEHIPVLRKNLVLHLYDGSFYVFGMSFIAIPTVYPVFIKELGGSPLAVGSVYVLWTIGANIYAAFMAQRLKKKSHYRPQMVFWGFVHRLMLFISGLIAAFVLKDAPPSLSVPLFLCLLFLTALFGNMSGLPWFLVYTKTVPVKLRGRLMGMRQLLGSGAGSAGGYLVGIIIMTFPFPINFSILFFSGFLFTMVSFYFLTRIKEQPTPQGEPNVQQTANIIVEAKRLLRTQKNYRNYLVADALILMSASSVSLYSIYALEKFSLPPSYAGTFSAIVMATNMVSNIGFGLLADYAGHRVNVISAACGFGLAAVCAIVSPNIFLYAFTFVFIAAALQIHMISRMPFVAELSSEQERPLYVGITNTLTAPVSLVGVLFGFLVPRVGYEIIFLATALLASGAVFVLSVKVTEPRFQKKV